MADDMITQVPGTESLVPGSSGKHHRPTWAAS